MSDQDAKPKYRIRSLYLGDQQAAAEALLLLLKREKTHEVIPMTVDERFPGLHPACHDGSSFLEVQCWCGTRAHVHESTIPEFCACGDAWGAGWLEQAFADLHKLANDHMRHAV